MRINKKKDRDGDVMREYEKFASSMIALCLGCGGDLCVMSAPSFAIFQWEEVGPGLTTKQPEERRAFEPKSKKAGGFCGPPRLLKADTAEQSKDFWACLCPCPSATHRDLERRGACPITKAGHCGENNLDRENSHFALLWLFGGLCMGWVCICMGPWSVYIKT